MTEKKRKPQLGIAEDGTTYVVEIPFDHPDIEKPYLAIGMTAAEIRTYNPKMSDEEVERHALRLARKGGDVVQPHESPQIQSGGVSDPANSLSESERPG